MTSEESPHAQLLPKNNKNSKTTENDYGSTPMTPFLTPTVENTENDINVDGLVETNAPNLTSQMSNFSVENDSKFTISDLQSIRDFNESYDDSVVLRWNNIKLSVVNPKKKGEYLTILDDISGYANKGELLGIIGASGGGKTSLLSMLSGRILKIDSLKSKSIKSGRIQFKRFIGDCSNYNTFQVLTDCIAYVLQEDILIPHETVKEALVNSSIIRLENKTKQQKIDIANKLMHDLDLDKVRDSKIGDDSFRGLSGGEKKRVSIGLELVTSPNMLLLDEPTTGLDSFSAYETMKLLKKLCSQDERKKCVICSIHSPSSEIFDLLDRIIILAKGKVVYQGYTSDLVDYLRNIGYTVPKYTNVADYILQQLHYTPDPFIEHWDEYVKNESILMKNAQIKSFFTPISRYQFYMAPIYVQISQLFKRNFFITLRNRSSFGARLFEILFTGFLLGLLWFQQKNLNNMKNPYIENDPENNANGFSNCQDRYGAIFYACLGSTFNSVLSAVLTFPLQKASFQKERSSNWYYTLVWLFTKWLIDIPLVIILNFLYAIEIKYMVNFHASFFEIFLPLVLISLCGDSYGLLIGTVSQTIQMSLTIAPLAVTPLMLLCGFLINIQNIPIYLSWYRFINPLWYGASLWGIKEYTYNKNNIGYGYGNDFKDIYDIKHGNYLRNIYAMIGIFLGYRFIAVCILVYKNGW